MADLDPADPAADPAVHRTTNEARSGTTPHIVRYVLTISLGLAILAMAIVLLAGGGAEKTRDPAGTTPGETQLHNSAVPTVAAPPSVQAPEPGTVTQQGSQPAPSER